ncbi:uncharacterized protein LOC143542511 [Bidens hawaiensis]|uniref:uncharacterized protein LOC143542511 n=1 Tax=Bidens hawaiensis TaxID=980011 RepID=UPI00404B5652
MQTSHFILRHLRRPSRHDHHLRRHLTTSSVVSSINWVRDRALDHAVEKERDLKPMINLKNLINSEPSKSLPLSIISDQRSSLCITNRPIDFIRKYPSVFQEYLPAGIQIHPHVKLTPETLTLDADEQIMFETESYKIDVANRLLKLLMLARVNKIPLSVINRLKWDLGLPDNYTVSIVPQFPDYFKVTGNGDELELVCWNDELAVSVMEANSMSSFPVQYSRGFEVDKKFKRWVDDWQKLPYVSPYESPDLEEKSEGFDKWIVGLLHEVLHILVPKKTEKDNLLCLGEYLGVRSRFKKALLEHPGIFYASSKLRTHTVVLREGYKRDLLVTKPWHPLMNLRSSYIHLMYMVKEKSKSKDADVGQKKRKMNQDLDGEDVELTGNDVGEEEEDDYETEGVIDGDGEDDDSESEELEVVQRTPVKKTGRFEGRKISVRTRRSDDNGESEDLEVIQRTPTKKTAFEGRKIPGPRSRARRNDDNGESVDLDNGNGKIRGRTSRTVRFNESNSRNTPNSRADDNNGRRGRRNDKQHGFDSRTNRVSDGRVSKEASPPRFLGTEAPGARQSRHLPSERPRTREGQSSERPRVSIMREGRSSERSGVSRTKEGRSLERSGISRTGEGRSSQRSDVSRTRERRF